MKRLDLNEFRKENIKVKADIAISIGSMCRPAHYLRKNYLRRLTCPLDWMINDDLNVVYKLFSTDFKDFFLSCEKVEIQKRTMIVDDKINKIRSIHHFFSNEDLAIQSQRVNTQSIKRWKKIKDIISNAKHSVFVFASNHKPANLKEFGEKIALLFQNNRGGGLRLSML